MKDQGVDVVTPFAYAGTVNGSQTYKGLIKDGSSKLEVWNREITYTLSDTREEAKAAFSQAITAATNNGYSSTHSEDKYWFGNYGNKYPLTVGTKVVVISMCEPHSNCGTIYTMSFSDYFSVATEYQTRIG